MVTLLALDGSILRDCPVSERRWAYFLSSIALANGCALGCSVSLVLVVLGEAAAVAAFVGLCSGAWFLNLQRLILFVHGEQRVERNALFSRYYCALMLFLFASVTAAALSAGLQTGGLNTHVGSSVAVCFLLPLFARRLLLRDSHYSARLAQSQSELSQKLEEMFSTRREAIKDYADHAEIS